MQFFIYAATLFLGFSSAHAALPPQFSECLAETTSTNMSVTDLKEIAKVSKVTYCQNQMGIIGKAETQDLLSSPNINVGISVGKTTYSILDFQDMAKSGSYVLYVDSPRLNRDELVTLARAGVQLVVTSSTSGLSKTDLMTIAAVKPFIMNVNSMVSKLDLQDYVKAGVQIVIRSSQAGLSKSDIMDVALLNSNLVTIMP